MSSLVLSVQDVRFAWGGTRQPAPPLTIDIAQLDLQAGEHVFVQGPSGCGKSTLLALIAGVLTPQHGQIQVQGQPMSKAGGAARDRLRADHIGLIFQQFNLIPYLSAVQNVALACQFSGQRKQAAVQQHGTVQQAAQALLNGLDLDTTHHHKKATELSVGQQQRVAAARALIGAPALVIADEPTSALDTSRQARFIELLLTQSKQHNTAILFVSHDPQLATQFDRVIDLPTINRAAQVELMQGA